jgi:amidophosphoribosyltransferase
MCGVIGIAGTENACELIYLGLRALQHRGQEGAGIVTSYEGDFKIRKGQGLVTEVFDDLSYLEGSCGIGHVRYPTAGSSRHVQPYIEGNVAAAHNGDIVNYSALRAELDCEFESDCDGELFAKLLAVKISDDIFSGVSRVMSKLKGSYSAIALIGEKLLAIRDPFGIKPFVYGSKREGRSLIYGFASESLPLTQLGFDKSSITNVQPGWAYLVNGEKLECKPICPAAHTAYCAFEKAYFSHSNSYTDEWSISRGRSAAGKLIARKLRQRGIVPDAVTAVPDTARTAAIACARELGVAYGENIIVKDRYSGARRTFIEPDERKRAKLVETNYYYDPWRTPPVVAIVDDSIVRGTTQRQVVQGVRRAGAKEVHVRIVFPKIVEPCYIGAIDFKEKRELFAVGKTDEDLRRELGADTLEYLSIDEFAAVMGYRRDQLCLTCVGEKSPIELSAAEKEVLSRKRAAERALG